MSDASTQGNGSGGRPFLPVAPSPGERRLPPPLAKLDQAALEQSAQVLGWRPKEEWQGDPAAFRDAKTFLEQAFTSDDDRIARNNLTQALGSHRQLAAQAQLTQANLNEALETIKGLTTQFRAFTDRGYQRTREELDAQRTAAVAAGDTGEFQRLDKQLRDLDESQRAAPAARPGAGGDQAAGGDQGAGGTRQAPAVVIPPDAQGGRGVGALQSLVNFTDQDMRDYTDRYDTYLRATSPGIGPIEHLKQLTEAVGERFPGRMPGQQRPNNGGGDGGGSQRRAGDTDGGSGLSGAGGGGGNRNRRTFDTMPKESKDQYARYAKLLTGKGEPLTKDEWATSYWAQFPEEG